MKKDVIYIDIEDDITSIIEKLKASNEKIVALVPPKGNAVLQSVVNLKLLKRAAGTVGKQPVIVTSNQALTALAGGLSLYVAKNLQSKPVLASSLSEVPEEEAVEVSDEMAEAAPISLKDTNSNDSSDDSDEMELSGEELAVLEAADTPEAAVAAEKKPKKTKKVPNFDKFKKKLLIVSGIALLLLIIILAVFGRTKASVVIRAETTPVDVALEANLNANSKASDLETYNLKAVEQETKKTITQSFPATGQKDVGTKASGTMTISNCQTPSAFTVAQGTSFSSGNFTFVSTQAVTVPGAQGNFISGCTKAGAASVPVIATANGDNYNLSPRSYSNSLGESITSSGGQMSGGTSKVIKIISQEDVNKARAQLDQQDTNQIRADLKKAFGDNVTVFDDSFVATLANVRSEPGVGEEANEGRLSAEATYSMLGINNSELGAALDAFIVTKMTNKDQQRVYDNGFKNMKFEKLAAAHKTATYKITTLAQYGPQFDTEKLKDEIKGKKFGEARSYLQDLPGVKGIDIKLTPFWARNLPDPSRIKINLDVDQNSGG